MHSALKKIEAELSRVMQRDRFRFRQTLRKLRNQLKSTEKAEPHSTKSSASPNRDNLSAGKSDAGKSDAVKSDAGDQDAATSSPHNLSAEQRGQVPTAETEFGETEIEKLEQAVAKSVALRNRRQQNQPAIHLDPELPIFERADEIAEAIKQHQVLVVSGETGSGKSTQLPLIAMKAGYGVAGIIGHTQPRRIAARGVAARIAQQLKTNVGNQVGFKIRFDDKTSDQTIVKLMTDGILLAETQSDRFLDQYDLLIVDEAHERSLNIDFLLGYLKRILIKRPDFRLIITSATIDTERFAEHFSTSTPAPVINVQGRTYPVDIRYKAIDDYFDDDNFEANDGVVAAVQELCQTDGGDMLVFLPTENDIRTVSRKLKAARLAGRAADILPLYARLSTEQQNLIFKPNPKRRIVLATNVAESSITVPGIRFVLDTGTARISRYAPRSKVQRLPIEAISQASANQRAGRCGRVGPGICLRLFTEDDFKSRHEFTTPEIRRTNLASVILQTLNLRLGNISTFPFIDPPHAESIRDGFKTLFEIGAIDDHRRLTKIGRWLGRLPVDPRIGKMLWAADQEKCLSEILIIAAALEIQDPRIRPAEHQKAADTQHEKFAHPKSDFMSYLKLWDFIHQLKEQLSRSKFKIACKRNFLSLAHIHQWLEVHRQLKSMCRQNGLKSQDRRDDYNAIHRSLLSGLLSGIAQLGDRYEYTGSGGIKFHIWPGSGVFEAKPKWAVAGEVVETSRRYGRTLAKIAPEWIEPLAEHLVKRTYHDPHWSKKRQTVQAYENVSLFGLPIVTRRRIGFTKQEPDVARDLFIESALVGGELNADFDFYIHNQCLLEDLQQLASKTRRRELVLDDAVAIDFYQQRLPEQAVDTAALKRLLKKDRALNERLKMTQADILPGIDGESTEKQFPSKVQVGSMNIPVEYCFQPGDAKDGATVQIPVEGLGQLDDTQAGWLIPGQFEERIVALIKSLPKSLRRNFVPAPETARQVAKVLQHGQGAFDVAVAQELTRICGQPITVDQFDASKTSPHLKVNLQVVDEVGEVLAVGRSVAEVREQLGAEFATNVVQVEDQTWSQDGLREWSWGELPKKIEVQRGGTQLAAFPAIVDQEDSVGLRLVDSPAGAKQETQQGLVRLFQIRHRKLLRSQVNWLPEMEGHAVKLASLIPPQQLKQQLGELMIRVALVERDKVPRDRESFEQLNQSATEKISIATQEVARWLPRFAKHVHAAKLALEQMAAKFSSAKGDIRQQIKQLTGDRFISNTPWCWLQNFPRYFQAIEHRIEKLPSTAADRDREAMVEIQSYWEKFDAMHGQHANQSIVDPELTQFRWMIEEYRVSLFAQQLGTSLTVSDKRLDKQWNKVRQI